MPAKSKTKLKYPHRTRPRAPASPDAISFTIPGFQSMGGPGKTSIDKLAKAGVLTLYKDAIGRTLITGDSAREYLRVKDDASAYNKKPAEVG